MIKPIDILPKYGASSQEWINFYNSLEDNYGKKDAKLLWVKAWQKRENDGANTVALRNFLRDKGIDIESSYVEELKDSLFDVTDYFQGRMRYLNVVLILLILAIVFIAVKNPDLVSMVATGGRSAVIPKS